MTSLTHLDRLEAEAINIIRETAAQFKKPVLLYSIGKDSGTLLHLCAKAFYPASRRSRCFTSTPPGSSRRRSPSATGWPSTMVSSSSSIATRMG